MTMQHSIQDEWNILLRPHTGQFVIDELPLMFVCMAGLVYGGMEDVYKRQEYTRYCKERGLMVGNESAAEFVHYKDEQLEAAMESGDA